jgi:anti-sigma factor RsiW
MSDITNEQLSAYLDDALSPNERASVERSLSESPNLQQGTGGSKKS